MEAHHILAVIAIALSSFSIGFNTGKQVESLKNCDKDSNDKGQD